MYLSDDDDDDKLYVLDFEVYYFSFLDFVVYLENEELIKCKYKCLLWLLFSNKDYRFKL